MNLISINLNYFPHQRRSLKITNQMKLFILIVLYFTSGLSLDSVQFKDFESSGSDSVLEECENHFIGYPDTFLRGVKEEFFLTYNSSNLQECKQHCCLEKKFFCQSFSHLKSLRVCYVMNVSMYDDVAKLNTFKGWSHYYRVLPTEAPTTTTVLTTTSSITTPSSPVTETKVNPPATTTTEVKNFTTGDFLSRFTTNYFFKFPTSAKSSVTPPSNSRSIQSSAFSKPVYDVTIHSTASLPDKTSKVKLQNRVLGAGPLGVEPPTTFQPNPSTGQAHVTSNDKLLCNKSCGQRGSCEFRSGDGTGVVMACSCENGYIGHSCDEADRRVATAGVPPYWIIAAVLGSLIFILLIILLVLYVMYRKKTGMYRVRKQRERWNKRNRQTETRRQESAACMGSRSPISSELSAPGSLNSVVTRSTVTSP